MKRQASNEVSERLKKVRKTEGMEGPNEGDLWEDIAIDSLGTGTLLLLGQNYHTSYESGSIYDGQGFFNMYDYDYTGGNRCATVNEFPVGVDWYQSESGDGDSSNEEPWRVTDAVGDPYWWFSANALAVTATPPGLTDCLDSKNWFSKAAVPPPTTAATRPPPTTLTTNANAKRTKPKPATIPVSSSPPTSTTAKTLEPKLAAADSSVPVVQREPEYSPPLSPPYSPLSPSSPDEASPASSGCSSPTLYASTETTPPASTPSKRRSRKHSSSSSSSSSLSSSSSSLPSTSSTPSNKTKQGGRTRGGHFPKETTDLLKQWLFAHTEHPYPTEEEKLLLAENTGLTVKQINYWFTNSRRRFLKKSGEL